NRLERHRTAGQMQPREWFFYSIEADSSRDPLYQFLTIGLLHHSLAFSPLVISSIHKKLSSPVAPSSIWKALQNPPIIFHNHSITQGLGASILFSDRTPTALLGLGKLDFSSRTEP